MNPDYDWFEVHLGDHVTYLKTAPLSRAQLDSCSPTRCLHYGDIHTRSSVTLDTEAEVMPRSRAEYVRNANRLRPGDIVFVDASEDQSGIGKSVEITAVPQEGVVSGLHTIAARFDKTVMADGFKAYLQFNPNFRNALVRLAAGTKVYATTRAHISSVSLALPSISEQTLIADALTDADHLITTLERLIAKKQAIKQGMMQQLLTGKTRLPGFTEPWREVRLGDVATMSSGGTPPSGTSRFYGGGIPWVSISDMTKAGRFVRTTEKTLSADGLISSAAQLYGDGVVLYAMYASLGECAVAVGRVSSSQAILGISPGNQLNRDFLYYHLSSIKSSVRELGQHGTQANLNAGMVRSFRLSLPPTREQKAIADVLADSDDELGLLQLRLSKAQAIKQGMMQELLTGRTRLPIKEVAS